MNIDFNHIPPLYTDDKHEPRGINVIIETPKGSRHKYACKEQYGIIELRRILRGGMVWPCDFGFVPQTHADDGDAIDVALFIDEPCFPGCLVRARVLGSIGLIKNGDENDRHLACPISLSGAASVWDEVRDLEDVSTRLIREIEGFLKDYQTFEGNEIELTGIKNADAAWQSVQQAAKRWRTKRMPELYLFGGPNGAGKTTIARELLPALGCREFVNADAIASALSPFNAKPSRCRPDRL